MTGSESAKLELKKMGIKENKITIIPHGVIVQLPKKRLKKEKTKTVIFLGALAKDKGVEDALKCFSILNKLGDYKFWVVGKGGQDYNAKLFQLSKELGIKNKVKFFGFVNQKTKFELLAKAHALINPSLLEGWGLVNIEANSTLTPVVAYNSPGLIDSVKHNETGIIVKENNPQSLAKEIDNLLRDKKKYKKLQVAAVKFSESFSWNDSKKLSLRLIANLAIAK